MKIRYIVPLLALALSFGVRAADGGSLKGTVKYDGEAPEAAIKEVPPENKAECKCAGPGVPDESLVVDKTTKGLKWAIIRIMDIKDAPPLPKADKPFQLNQQGCMFTPHVVVVPPDTDLEVLNPDKITHNIHTLPFDTDDQPQNSAQGPGEPVKIYKAKWLKEPDLIQVNCDMHKWMKGFIVCHDPRYCAVTGADGTFEIKNVPPGKYKVNIYQESFGNYMKKDTIDVEIKAGAATDMGELKFPAKK